jgi:hypothetical protein
VGWVVITGVTTLLPELLDEEDELELEDEELLEDEEEDELELLEELEEDELELLLDGVVTLMAVVLALRLLAAS